MTGLTSEGSGSGNARGLDAPPTPREQAEAENIQWELENRDALLLELKEMAEFEGQEIAAKAAELIESGQLSAGRVAVRLGIKERPPACLHDPGAPDALVVFHCRDGADLLPYWFSASQFQFGPRGGRHWDFDVRDLMGLGPNAEPTLAEQLMAIEAAHFGAIVRAVKASLDYSDPIVQAAWGELATPSQEASHA